MRSLSLQYANSLLQHMGSSSLTGNQTWAPALAVQSPKHRTTSEESYVSIFWGEAPKVFIATCDPKQVENWSLLLLSALEDVTAPLRKQRLCSMSPFSTCGGVVEAGRRARPEWWLWIEKGVQFHIVIHTFPEILASWEQKTSFLLSGLCSLAVCLISSGSPWKWKWSPSVVSDSLRPHGL